MKILFSNALLLMVCYSVRRTNGFLSLTAKPTLQSVIDMCSSNVGDVSKNAARDTTKTRESIAYSIAKCERRAKDREAPKRTVCDVCARPPTLCMCEILPFKDKDRKSISKLKKKTHILILQHPNERRKKNISTVPLLQLALENVHVLVGYKFNVESIVRVQNQLYQSGNIDLAKCRPLLLYPSADAIILDEAPSNSGNQERLNKISSNQIEEDGNLLIIIDGTWNEAKRMIRESPSLVNHCQGVQFTTEASSIYDALREEPEEHCVSTLEACARALMLLEPTSASQDAENDEVIDSRHKIDTFLHKMLRLHVDKHLNNARIMEPRSMGTASARVMEKKRRKNELELRLFTKEEGMMDSDLVVEDEDDLSKKEEHRIFERLPDGSILRSLRISDAPHVDSRWEFRSEKSLPLMRRKIQLDHEGAFGGCLGIVVDGNLVASIMRYEGGALGILFVEEDYRRRGYGLALLQRATQNLLEKGHERVAYIMDGNTASETLFEKAGWKRDPSNKKRGTGKRRSKRKWIHSIESETKEFE